jgi:hypothetical protein
MDGTPLTQFGSVLVKARLTTNEQGEASIKYEPLPALQSSDPSTRTTPTTTGGTSAQESAASAAVAPQLLLQSPLKNPRGHC